MKIQVYRYLKLVNHNCTYYYSHDTDAYKKILGYEHKIIFENLNNNHFKAILFEYYDSINSIHSNPVDISDICDLRNFIILYTYFQLKTIPSNILKLCNLKILNLSHNNLIEIPINIINLINLEELYVHNNNLSTISDSLYRLPKLQILNLSHNNLTEISDNISNLTTLIELNLAHNKLSKLPKNIAKLNDLEILNVAHNIITKIDFNISNMSNLREFNIESNNLCEINYNLTHKTLFLKNNNLKSIDLSNTHISDIPEWVLEHTSIKELYLDDNKISTLSDNINVLQQLQKISISNNLLENINLKQSTKITSLYADTNKLKDVKLPSLLNRIDLSDNKLELFPKDILTCSQLEILHLNMNLIQSIPDSINKLNALRELNICNNPINTLPSTLCECLKLKYLLTDYEVQLHLTVELLKNIVEPNKLRNTKIHYASIYDDKENIHNVSLHKSVLQSIENIMNHSTYIDFELLIEKIISNQTLTNEAKSILIEYSFDTEVHPVIHIKFIDLLHYVYNIIEQFDLTIQHEIFLIMHVEMEETLCKCFSAKLSHLVNCLNGFSPLVKISIPESYQIADIIENERKKMGSSYNIKRHRQLVKNELTDRAYEDAVIEQWVSYIEE